MRNGKLGTRNSELGTALILCVALAMGMCVTTSSAAWTLKGIGAHRGLDLYELDPGPEEFLLRDGTSARLTVLEKIERPEIFGGHLHMAPWPLFDVEFSVEGVKKEYEFTFVRAGAEPIEDEARFTRYGVYASIRRDLIGYPGRGKGATVYVGAGAGFQFVRAVLSEKTIFEGVEDLSARFDMDELTERTFGVAWHAIAGLSVRPSRIPFSVYADLTRVRMGNSPVEELKVFTSLHVGVSLSF